MKLSHSGMIKEIFQITICLTDVTDARITENSVCTK